MNIAITVTKCTITSLILMMLALASPETAEARPGNQGIVGAWVVDGQPDGAPPFRNIGTLHRDGTTVNADPVFGPGHGVWQRTGVRRFAVRFVTITSPFNPVLPNTVITVNGELTLRASRNSATGTFETTFTDLNGNPVMPPSTGTVEFTRIGIN